ncbi:MAG: hypothetical protein SCJ93_14285, partial [Bacillota bacterium]|nr:hypothetical protein [Bacillota bacterium]
GGFIKYIFDLLNSRRKEKKINKLKVEKQIRDRPEFKITKMEDYFDYPGEKIDLNNESDLEIFTAKIEDIQINNDIVTAGYDESNLDKDKWVYRKYELENIGRTVIYETAIISNFKRTTCIFDIRSIEEFIRVGGLNYSDISDKRIAPGEKIEIKIFYHTDRITTGWGSAIFEIGFRDDNRNFWMQPFFAPEDKLYKARRVTYKEYLENIRPDTAIECFKKPYLW